MGILAAVVALVSLFGIERAAAFWRRRRFNHDRAKADYPITGSDPTGNSIA